MLNIKKKEKKRKYSHVKNLLPKKKLLWRKLSRVKPKPITNIWDNEIFTNGTEFLFLRESTFVNDAL